MGLSDQDILDITQGWLETMTAAQVSGGPPVWRWEKEEGRRVGAGGQLEWASAPPRSMRRGWRSACPQACRWRSFHHRPLTARHGTPAGVHPLARALHLVAHPGPGQRQRVAADADARQLRGHAARGVRHRQPLADRAALDGADAWQRQPPAAEPAGGGRGVPAHARAARLHRLRRVGHVLARGHLLGQPQHDGECGRDCMPRQRLRAPCGGRIPRVALSSLSGSSLHRTCGLQPRTAVPATRSRLHTCSCRGPRRSRSTTASRWDSVPRRRQASLPVPSPNSTSRWTARRHGPTLEDGLVFLDDRQLNVSMLMRTRCERQRDAYAARK
jgi:hypothetical protein